MRPAWTACLVDTAEWGNVDAAMHRAQVKQTIREEGCGVAALLSLVNLEDCCEGVLNSRGRYHVGDICFIFARTSSGVALQPPWNGTVGSA